MVIDALRFQQQATGAHFSSSDPAVAEHYGDSANEYQAVLQSAALFETSATGRIWLRDRDRAALLHRMSTNNIQSLLPGQGTQTVLTNHNGRIIDLLTVHAFADELLVVTSPRQGSAVLSLLRKNIFFNDKVKIEDAGETLGQFALYGPRSSTLLQQVTGIMVDDLPLYAIRAAAIGDTSLWIARIKPLGGMGFALYIPVESLASIWTTLVQAGAQPLGQIAYDCLRVEAGYGAYGRELSLDYIPLETGLWDAVSFTKGCYVGQEIIARMESRNRIAKHLCGLKLSGTVDAPRKLAVAGKDAGDLTSVVESPRLGVIGLAYVRHAYAQPGTQVAIVDSAVTGEVVTLPFATTS